MIDKETGDIQFPDWEISLSSSLTRERSLKSPLASDAKVSVKNEPYCSWRLVPTNWKDNQWWHITVFFKGETLYQVNLGASKNELGSEWKDWSEETEISKRDYYVDLLGRLLGVSMAKHFDFSWGSIEAIYDEKTGGSHIMIKYGTAQDQEVP